MMSRAATWVHRHDQLTQLLDSPQVVRSTAEALQAANLIPQTDENAASCVASHQYTLRIVDEDNLSEELGRRLDASIAVLWSAPTSSRDTNEKRLAVLSSLRSLLHAGLSESSKDLSSITCLESNREGTVELVRCRMDHKIYVLKSTTKGAAKRGFRSNSPVTERRLLSLSQGVRRDQLGKTAFTPSCIAAFQSPGSLHILMEYCPAGDLYHFLESAGEAPITNDARNKTGGLLAERYVRRYAIDMVAAIAWIHEQGFMHRDIKPGNWLFDKTGHLLLCDLASAAPFAKFEHVPPSANLPEEDECAVSKVWQRRVLYRHCCLIGTADYIAPEIFWSADLISRRRQRKVQREQERSESRITSRSSCSISEEEEEDDEDDDDEPPPGGPGLYGPECDWWSLGVVLFEMVYKKMPFFSDKIAETMEMIKHHDTYFKLDSRVQCSARLLDLLTRLISSSEKRIGFSSSAEVERHAFFEGVDWDRPWEGEAVPFVPNLSSAAPYSVLQSPGGLSILQEEPSVLHSPNMKQGMYDSGHGSGMWSGHPHDFPAFPNSVEMSRTAGKDLLEEGGEDQDGSEDTITTSSPSTRLALDQQKTRAITEAERLWSKYDPTWIGFSYVPDKSAFGAGIETDRITKPSMPSPISSPENVSSHNLLYSPTVGSSSLPMVSTPCQSGVDDFEETAGSTPLQSTPFHPSVALNLHRRAMETASRVRSESIEQHAHHPFKTPMRKTSTPILASQNDRQQMMSNLQTPANLNSSRSSGLSVPASPYPFPLGTAARQRMTPAPPNRIPSSGLRRADLQRARSASVEAGEGSESRCSGGSNVKRDISEAEAWRELKVAVMQSARKGRKDFVKGLEEKRRTDRGQATAEPSRPILTHAATDSNVRSVASAIPTTSAATVGEMSKKSSAFPFGALGGALKGRRPNMPRFLSHNSGGERDRRPEPLKPVVNTTSPERAASIISSSASIPSSTPEHPEQKISSLAARSRLILPSFWQRHNDTGKLSKKKSARQLLLKAQDRETPTKVASRSNSPLLASFPNLSLENTGVAAGTKLEDASRHDVGSSPTCKQRASARREASESRPSIAVQSINVDSDDSASTSSSRHGERSSDMSSPPQAAMVTQLKREENSMQLRMRRRDSREMLSQYRQGINPDETVEHMETILPTNDARTANTLASRRGPKRVMSIQVLRPTSANAYRAGTSMGDEVSSLSSPSLPSFPDAFTGPLSAKNLQDGRRASFLLPARTTTNSTMIDQENRQPILPPEQRFRTLQTKRSARMNNRSGNMFPSSTSQEEPTAKTMKRQTSGGGTRPPETQGDVSMLTGLDWRYESMKVNLSQVEERLERIKARLRDD